MPKREELRRFRGEVKQLGYERDIVSEVAARFANYAVASLSSPSTPFVNMLANRVLGTSDNGRKGSITPYI
jgi:hypothetical protein